MSNRRLAALYRDRARAARALADVDERIAEALEGEEPANDAEPQRVAKKPARPLTDVDRARARRNLRRLGVDV